MSNEQTFPATRAYLNLDLGPESVAFRELMVDAEEEARGAKITLIEDGVAGSPGSGMTRGMSAWLGTYVLPHRKSALAELEGAANRIKIGRNVGGVLIELEQDKLKREQVRRRSEIYAAFHDAHEVHLTELNDLEAEYDTQRVRANRDAHVPNRILEWGILFPFVLIPEAFLNFESFRRAPIISSDAMALGITIIVGLGIAAAAHVLGSLSKQFNHFTRPDHPERQGDGFRKAAWGSALLCASLTAVGVARFYYLLPLRQEAIILGQDPPNLLAQIGGSVIGNVIVFLIGAVITYLLEDPDPDFSARKRKLDEKTQLVEALKRTHITGPLNEVDRRQKRDLDDVRVVAQQMDGKAGYSELREEFSRFLGKDAQVLGLLNRYRGKLVSEIEKRDPEFTVDNPYLGADRGGERIKIKLADFAALAPHLYLA